MGKYRLITASRDPNKPLPRLRNGKLSYATKHIGGGYDWRKNVPGGKYVKAQLSLSEEDFDWLNRSAHVRGLQRSKFLRQLISEARQRESSASSD